MPADQATPAHRLWFTRGQPLWRRHADSLNAKLVERWLSADAHAILKTDLWDEAVGKGLYPTLRRDRHVVGIDCDAFVVERARAHYPELQAVEADVRSLPFPDGRFDAVVSNSTLDHLPSKLEIERALREMRRVLRPGGELVITLDNPHNPLVALLHALPRRLLERVWATRPVADALGLLPYELGATLGPASLALVLESVGFEVRERDSFVHAPRPLAVVIATLVERHGSARAQRRYLSLLESAERLGRYPTRSVTAFFIAAKAVRVEMSRVDRSSAVVGPGRAWTLRSAAARTREVLCIEGVRSALFRALGETVYRRVMLVEFDVAGRPRAERSSLPLEFGFLAPAEVDELGDLDAHPGADRARARLVRGERCFVARHEGRIVSASWLTDRRGWVEYLSRSLSLAPGEVYLYEAFTHPEYRGRGIFTLTAGQLAQALAVEGTERIIAVVVPESQSAVRAFAKAGYRHAGRIGYVRLGPWRRDFVERSQTG